jgi:hypothetical protein
MSDRVRHSSCTGLLSLFNIGGRFLWASLSDHIGCKAPYCVFFLLGIAMYSLAPCAAHAGSMVLFVAWFRRGRFWVTDAARKPPAGDGWISLRRVL